MIDKLLEWRIYTKLRSTYVDALPTLMAEDGRLHTTFHQAVAATGRLSSSDPNLQNIPIRTPLGRRIRRAFVAGGARPDARRRRLQPDRAAHPRPRLGRRAPPRRVRAPGGHPPRDGRPRPPQGPGRRDARRAVDGQDGQLRDRLRDVATSGCRAGEHPARRGAGVHQHLLRDLLRASGTTCSRSRSRRGPQGFVTTLLGRKRQIPELAARNPTLRAAGERMAINMPIQGTAADIVKIAMIRLDERLAAGGLPGAAAAPGPRRAAARGAARRGRPAGAGPARDDGGRAAARRPADGRHQDRRRLGIDDAADPRRRDRGRGGRGARLEAPLAPIAGYVAPMPELPEVETVARDLRPRIVGATITGARMLVGADAEDAHAEAFAAAIAGRRVEAVGRRAKQVVVELSGRRRADHPSQDDRPALRRARPRRRRIPTSGSSSSWPTAASSGSATSASSGRSGCTGATR